jgi:hypothetical protein
MTRRIGRIRKTDYGTIVLHWSLVGALVVAILTGLRIATEVPDRTWINMLDAVLPTSTVWSGHIPAAVVLVTVSIAYAVYMGLSGLGHRIRLDRARLAGLFGSRQTRWGAVNVLLYWLFYAVLLAELATGVALYLGSASSTLVDFHWLGMWVILGYAVLHVLAHLALGGQQQLLRMFRPARIMPVPPPFDPAELLALLDRPGTSPGAARRSPAAPPRPRPLLRSVPLVGAIGLAVIGVTLLVVVERQTEDRLVVRRIGKGDAPVLDGDSSDPIWRMARPVRVLTEQGGNFDGKGETSVEIRAVHDGTWAYFLFVWEDPTRSLKQLPLMKGGDGWHLLHDGFEAGDEHAYNEDKFSVLLTTSEAVLAGDQTFHAGRTPVSGSPSTLSGRGLHYTPNEGIHVDVWQWKATSSGGQGWLDDSYFGPPARPTAAQIAGVAPYRGGFAPDPGTSNYDDNFDPRPSGGYGQSVTPRRLPKDYRATMAALGQIDLDPNHSDSDGSRWFLTEAESAPYSRALDDQIPTGSIIPGVIIAGEYSGDRADVRCAARWAGGRWVLETARRLDTGSPYDIPIAAGTSMRVAAFDHSQIRHTRHVRPIRLEVE